MASGGSRPGSGRRRKSLDLKKLEGTSRKDRDGGGDVPATPGSLVCPAHMSDLEQLYFGSIAHILEEQRRSSPHFSEHVGLLAVRLAQIERYKAVLECDGDTFETRTSTGALMIRKHPAVQMLSDAMRHAQSLLGELMLNPSAAMRLAEGEKPDDGGLAAFFQS
ncbi:P27 family phage terminase small subunit [Qipengyuania sp.]|uniref:P27 family phage terminase small subunit n=1 Tax=Qipengyuania sp. TaxID=2004515 RepID=UPI0035177046